MGKYMYSFQKKVSFMFLKLTFYIIYILSPGINILTQPYGNDRKTLVWYIAIFLNEQSSLQFKRPKAYKLKAYPKEYLFFNLCPRFDGLTAEPLASMDCLMSNYISILIHICHGHTFIHTCLALVYANGMVTFCGKTCYKI